METIKGIVLEQKGSKCIIMGSDGSFRKIANKANTQVGEEIEIALASGSRLNSLSRVRIWAGVAALFLVVFTATLGWNLWQASTAVALVSVDINPSLELSVNAKNKVLKATAMNEDAQMILDGESLKGQTITKAMQEIVAKAIEYKFLSSDQAWIVVGVSCKKNTAFPKSSELASPQLINTVKQATQDQGLNPQIAVLKVSDQDRKNAKQEGLTVGQYVLWQNANKAGLEIKPQKLKDKTERQRILEDPQVQKQLKSEQNMVDAHPMSKEIKGNPNTQHNQNGYGSQDQKDSTGQDNTKNQNGKMQDELNVKGQGMEKDQDIGTMKENIEAKEENKEETDKSKEETDKNKEKDNNNGKNQRQVKIENEQSSPKFYGKHQEVWRNPFEDLTEMNAGIQNNKTKSKGIRKINLMRLIKL